ncbi:MAG TPA: hypothetical protein VD866_08435 [Urbifossiella sp.]|nr:hypothetical protein [Urbifossiella sp.]
MLRRTVHAHSGGRVIATTPTEPTTPVATTPSAGDGLAGADRQIGPEKVVPGYILNAAGDDPDAKRAIAFLQTFLPTPGVDYTWVEEQARRTYEQAMALFDSHDAKAGAVIGYVGAGAGFAAFGTMVNAANAAISPWVIVAAIPTVVLAGLAILEAAWCRSPAGAFRVPAADRLAAHAATHPDKKEAVAYLIPQWFLATALLGPVLKRKADLVDRATWNFAAAIVALALPLATLTVRRFCGW